MNSKKILEKIIYKWPAKVLSLLAALLIFMFYRMYSLQTRFFSVPLQVEAGETLVPVDQFPLISRISIKGESGKIVSILENDIEAFIDLKRYVNEGTYRVPVQINKKGSALEIDPLEITVEPAQIHIKLERKLSRNIQITPMYRGTVAEGYELTNYMLIPSSVTAEGPRSIMESIDSFQTSAIDLEGRYEDFGVFVNIINEHPSVFLRGNRSIEYRGSIKRIINDEENKDSNEYKEEGEDTLE